MNGTKEVTRDEWMALVTKKGKRDKQIHTINRSIWEAYSRTGKLLASAEYIRNPGAKVITIYRVVLV